ncbi:uncharacterized protein [Venturia canescens]|uniref:uncharacterized protein isoform X2 n=1 Tax=Venturia canescens TaxID=32260 RepID=UPI001C9C6097|nr:uncharacterized protein LOC122411138 isoform X2 [Venturia canescens]
MVQSYRCRLQLIVFAVPTIFFAGPVSAKFCNGGHVCSPPKECCTLGCCYVYSPPAPTLFEMFAFLISTYWAAILSGLALATICGCWLCHRLHRRDEASEDGSTSERTSSVSFYPPPHYSRCSSFIQALPPPYNEVTAKPDLYPLVIGYDEGIGKGTSGFVMRYFRTLSHASTLDSLSSSFMCNVVNEANTIIPPPYSCNNSLDGLSTMGGCERGEIINAGSIVSLANNRTTSDISSLAAQSPCSPPRATSPTVELRELLDKIQQLPQVPSELNFPPNTHNRNHHENRPNNIQQRPVSPGEIASSRGRRARGKMYMPLGLPSSRNKTKRWLSRSAPTTPSGTIPLSLFPGQSRRPSEHTDNSCGQQFVPLLAEQDENDAGNTLLHCGSSERGSSLPEQEEEQL